jgi:dedicated sortase system histidine kinase
MSLRRQLLLVSLLLIALPWAGCQYVREMEAALQSGQSQALLATTRAVATVVAEAGETLYADRARLAEGGELDRQLYAQLASGPVIVDGYDDGWEGPEHGRFGPVGFRALVRGGMLYLLFTVRDDNVVYHDPRNVFRASGDRIVLQTPRGSYIIATAAPGPVQARIERPAGAMGFEPRIRGYWQDSLEGFTVELELPLSLLDNRLGFYLVHNSDSATTAINDTVGNVTPGQGLPPWLVYPSATLQAQLAPFAGDGIELAVVDRYHWRLADAGEASSAPEPTETPWLLRAVYRAILNGNGQPRMPESPRVGQLQLPQVEAALAGENAAAWYMANGGRKLLASAAPVSDNGEIIAAVVALQSSEPYLTLTDRAFSRLVYYSLLAMLLSALGLLGYASWLSWRIRRLSRASATVIRPDGSLDDNFPVSTSRDEIGELSRQYAELLDRLRDYTDYLRSLSRKLSHELRTPIAVIQSSLDNLGAGSAEDGVYVQRAREGLSRLGNILTAMSEATRLEESVHNNQPEHYDLAGLCRDLFNAYRALYVDHRLQLECDLDVLPAHGVPDLVAQMLDKLMDNAASFAPAGGNILLSLTREDGEACLAVSNDGPPLPVAMQHQLFDSMVSVRDRSERVHLGLGLHIVRLIVEFHRGSVSADNRADGCGVIFTARLPLDLRA